MKTTVEIPDEVMAELLKVSGQPTKKAAINAAISDFLHAHRLRCLRDELIAFRASPPDEADLTVAQLRRQRKLGQQRRTGAENHEASWPQAVES